MLEIMKQKSRYMLEKPWYCDICLNNPNYSLAGTSRHLSTRMHKNKVDYKYSQWYLSKILN